MDKNNSNKGGNVTTDHEEIKQWAEERGGSPSMIKSTTDDEDGILRIDFGEKEDNLEPVSWEEFFRVFEDNNLAFLYQDKTADGSMSRFFKLIDRDSIDETEDDDDEEDEEEVADVGEDEG